MRGEAGLALAGVQARPLLHVSAREGMSRRPVLLRTGAGQGGRNLRRVSHARDGTGERLPGVFRPGRHGLLDAGERAAVNEHCWKCEGNVIAEPVYRGETIYTCWRHHPYRRRLFVLRSYRRFLRFTHLGVNRLGDA
jgi:hypothetical protein